jgi:LmbE family N-acetylglucosaminyl deacetylase
MTTLRWSPSTQRNDQAWPLHDVRLFCKAFLLEIGSETMTKTLLAVLAHPDDESFGLGGTLALYARRGVATYLVCATRGEAGDVAAEHLDGFKDIADKRTAELVCAASILGLKHVFYLGYRDSG